MTTTLSKHHQRTFDAFFDHPVPHNLHRPDVLAMLNEWATLTHEHNSNIKVTRNGETLVMHVSEDKNISDRDELTRIRHFLEKSQDVIPVSAAQAKSESPGHFLVVIDHREARVYKAELRGAIPEKITPYDPHGFDRALHEKEGDAGKRKPEKKEFYENIAKTLRLATEILIFGSGTAASSAMEQLIAGLKLHHHDLFSRIVGSVVLDTAHLTDAQLLEHARLFYDKLSHAQNASQLAPTPASSL